MFDVCLAQKNRFLIKTLKQFDIISEMKELAIAYFYRTKSNDVL